MEAPKLPVSMSKVQLRALEPEDLDLLYKVENDISLWKVGTTNTPYSRYALREYISNATGDIFTDHQVRMMICDTLGHTVGIVDMMNFNAQHQRSEVGIVIFEPFRNRGFGLAAMNHVLSYAHAILHIHKLYALVDVDNIYSRKLFERVGFSREGMLHDWLFDGDHYHDVIIYQKVMTMP